MFNINSIVSSAISVINPTQNVILVNRVATLENGYPEWQETRTEVTAQIQPVSADILEKFNELIGIESLNFWLSSNEINVINEFKHIEKGNTKIIYNNRLYEVYTLYDWSNSGWVQVIAILNDKIEEETETEEETENTENNEPLI